MKLNSLFLILAGSVTLFGCTSEPDKEPSDPNARKTDPVSALRKRSTAGADGGSEYDAGLTRRNFSLNNRLGKIDGLLARLENADYRTLFSLHSNLLGRQNNGFDTSLERKLVLYRLGQLDGQQAADWFLDLNSDRAEFDHGIILEGWAHEDPNAALIWWRELRQGRKRQTLLKPLLQGYLTSPRASWENILPSLTAEELAVVGTPIIESASGRESFSAAMQFFASDEFQQVAFHPKRNACAKLNEMICDSGDFATMQEWFDLWKSGQVDLPAERNKKLTLRLGAIGGAKALEHVSRVAPDETMRIAIGWVKSDPSAAGSWLRQNPNSAHRDQIAFQLAIAHVKENPESAREWARKVNDSEMIDALEDIFSRYEQ